MKTLDQSFRDDMGVLLAYVDGDTVVSSFAWGSGERVDRTPLEKFDSLPAVLLQAARDFGWLLARILRHGNLEMYGI